MLVEAWPLVLVSEDNKGYVEPGVSRKLELWAQQSNFVHKLDRHFTWRDGRNHQRLHFGHGLVLSMLPMMTNYR